MASPWWTPCKCVPSRCNRSRAVCEACSGLFCTPACKLPGLVQVPPTELDRCCVLVLQGRWLDFVEAPPQARTAISHERHPAPALSRARLLALEGAVPATVQGSAKHVGRNVKLARYGNRPPPYPVRPASELGQGRLLAALGQPQHSAVNLTSSRDKVAPLAAGGRSALTTKERWHDLRAGNNTPQTARLALLERQFHMVHAAAHAPVGAHPTLPGVGRGPAGPQALGRRARRSRAGTVTHSANQETRPACRRARSAATNSDAALGLTPQCSTPNRVVNASPAQVQRRPHRPQAWHAYRSSWKATIRSSSWRRALQQPRGRLARGHTARMPAHPLVRSPPLSN